MAESYLEINKAVDPDPLAKMKTFKTTDGGSNVVHAEGVVITDGTTGAEVHPLTDAQLRASPLPVSATITATVEGPVDQGTPNIDGNSWPVHQVGSAPLPTGAATEATLAELGADVDAIETNTGATASATASTAGATAATAGSVASIDGKTVHVDTGAVVVASSALPAGAATAAKQDTGNTSDASLDTKTVHVDTGAVVVASSALPTGAATAARQDTGNTSVASIDTKTPALVGGRVPVDGSGVTQPVSVVALPLPAGAATSANQTNGTQKAQVVDGAGNVQNAGDIAARAMFEKVTDGTNTAAVKAASTAAAGTDPALVVAVSPNNSVAITAAALPLPAGASTEATLAAAKADLDTIATNTTIAAASGLQNGAQVAVSNAAVVILAANAARRGAIIQNVGAANIRIGKAGVTAATGLQLRASGTMTLEPPFIPVGDIYAIREGAVDSTAYAAEVT